MATELDPESQEDVAHYLSAGENASRDADGLVAKLSTAGLTATAGVAGLSDARHWTLGGAAVAFAVAAIASLINQRLGADALRRLWEKTHELGSSREARKALDCRFKVIQALNWAAVLAIAAGFVAASWFALHELGGST